jgi:RimJ/RimL family protein N-acetyltransferase
MDEHNSHDPKRTTLEIAKSYDGSLNVSISTPRLNINSVKPEDAKFYHDALYSDPKVMQRFATGETKDMGYVSKRIASWTKRWQDGDPFSSLAVRLKDGTFIGQVVLGHGDQPGTAEIAYLIRKDHWKKGYGTEAVSAVCTELAPLLSADRFEVDGQAFRLIEATARPDNPASVKILEKIDGMQMVMEEEKFGAVRKNYRGVVGNLDPARTWQEDVSSEKTSTRGLPL